MNGLRGAVLLNRSESNHQFSLASFPGRCAETIALTAAILFARAGSGLAEESAPGQPPAPPAATALEPQSAAEHIVAIDLERAIFGVEESADMFSQLRIGRHTVTFSAPWRIAEAKGIVEEAQRSLEQLHAVFPERSQFELRTTDGFLFDVVSDVGIGAISCTSRGVFQEKSRELIEVPEIKIGELDVLGKKIVANSEKTIRAEWRQSFRDEISKAREAATQSILDEHYASLIDTFRNLPYKRGQVEDAQREYKIILSKSGVERSTALSRKASDCGISDHKILRETMQRHFEICRRYLQNAPFDSDQAARIGADLKVLCDGEKSHVMRRFEGVSPSPAPSSMRYRTDFDENKSSYFWYYTDGLMHHQQMDRQRLVRDCKELSAGKGKEVRTFDPATGTIKSMILWVADGETLRCNEFRSYYPNGQLSLVESVENESVNFRLENGTRIASISHDTVHRQLAHRWIFTGGGNYLGTFDLEKLRAPGLSDERYLAKLAQELTTPELIAWYLKICVRYTFDTVEDWQTPSRTVQRIEGGAALGDCEDYAFLARDILRRQGFNAHVILVPGHAECVWLTKDPAGRYHGWSLGTFGLDRDGQRYENESSFTHEGFGTAREALQSLMTKYRDGGIGMPAGTDVEINPDSIALGDLAYPSGRSQYSVAISYLLPSAKR